MAEDAARISGNGDAAKLRSKRRALIEIVIAYVLILAVIWTPRPWQRFLWLIAVAALATMTCLSFNWLEVTGLEEMGLGRKNFFRSLWVVGAALALAVRAPAAKGRMSAFAAM